MISLFFFYRDLPSILEDWSFKSVMGDLAVMESFLNDIAVNNEKLSHLNLKKSRILRYLSLLQPNYQ